MTRDNLRLLALGLLTALMPLSALGAEIALLSKRYSQTRPVPHLHLSGIIQKGDVDRLMALLPRAMDCAPDDCNIQGTGPEAVLTLDSPGGSLTEGLALADALSENAIATRVETGATCLSACALAFLGGRGAWSTGGVGFFVDRAIEPGADLGFHSPFFPDAALQNLSDTADLKQALDLTRLSISAFAGHLTRNHVNPMILDAVIEMGPNEFYRIDRAERLFYANTALPDFAPSSLSLTFEDGTRNACARLMSGFYGMPITRALSFLQDKSLQGYGVNDLGQAVRGFGIDDSPYVLSHCGAVSNDPLPNLISLYKQDSDISEAFIDMATGLDGGWAGVFPSRDVQLHLGHMTHLLLPPDQKLDALPAAAKMDMLGQRYHAPSAILPDRTSAGKAELTYASRTHRVWTFGDTTVFEQVANIAQFNDLRTEADGPTISLALSRDYPDAFVRSGTYQSGRTFYWAALQSEDTAYILRVEYGHEAAKISKAENKLTSELACSSLYKGVHLPCYK